MKNTLVRSGTQKKRNGVNFVRYWNLKWEEGEEVSRFVWPRLTSRWRIVWGRTGVGGGAGAADIAAAHLPVGLGDCRLKNADAVSLFALQSIVCTMGLKWYPHPELLHCIKGCEVSTEVEPRLGCRHFEGLGFEPQMLQRLISVT